MGRNKMSHGTSEISCLRKKLEEREKEITEKDEELAKKDEELAKKDEELAKKDEEIAKMKQELAESERKINKLCEQNELLRKKVFTKGASDYQPTVDVMLNDVTASEAANVIDTHGQCLGAKGGSNTLAHSSSDEPLTTEYDIYERSEPKRFCKSDEQEDCESDTVPDDWEERCEEPESKNLMEQDELLRKNVHSQGASSSQRTVDVFLNEATASDEPNFTEPRVECLGADSGSKPKAHSPSVEDADISHLQTSCANDDEPCTSPEAKATTNKTSRPSIPTPAAIENIFGPSQTLDSCYQELPKDWGKDWLPRRVPDVFSIKRFMNLKLPFYYVVYLIASLLQLLGKVHVKGILINSFSVENIRLFKIGGRLVLKISDPNMQATSMPLDLSNPMLERCQSDLIHTVKFCSEIITNYKGSKAVTGKDLDIYLGVFQIFKTDGIYSKCNAFINYFILISTNMKELHPLLKEYVKNPNFTFLYEGRNLHLFKETEHSCMHCILRIISQDIKMAPLNDIEYLRNNTVFGITDWKLHLDEHLVKDFEMGEKAKYSGKKVTNLFKFCKNVLSHLIERRNQYDDFSITLHRLGIHNDIDFMNYIESKIPKLPFHVFSGIYMYKRK
ncbi:uncharacterized protein LOC128234599 isoform X2 [Mya arenaria]|uniref:uncharacterized protein LOC128234599 isoform X2 n=1 Tax=Mya arenaria TaxID=6604 RepID=UPI0022E0D575|nr:uncharacterized protein LOC128234599 isoform X2 [Mya arenaria]